MEGWVIPLGFVLANGNVTQLYPAFCPAGVDPATAVNGQLIRMPTSGKLWQIQLQTDGTNGGIIEIYDINGLDSGINVSSATTITDTQLDAQIAAGNAKLIHSQNYIGSPETPINIGAKAFAHGLAARNVSTAGSVTLNLTVTGGYRLVDKVG